MRTEAQQQATFRGQYDRFAFLQSVAHGRASSLLRRREAVPDEVRLDRIDEIGTTFLQPKSDDQLRRIAVELRCRAEDKESEPGRVLEIAFALVREASRRTTGLYHYPEQILAGLALARGAVSEMATGEGKTLAITLPAFLFSLANRGVHVVTVNSYLAQRDWEFSRPIYEFLGSSSGLLPEGRKATIEGKRAAYDCDITYGVGYEFGFDYLRDQLERMRRPHGGSRETLRDALLGRVSPPPNICQRGLACAIIDEIDSVLIDEAGCPLLISESSEEESSSLPFLRALEVSRSLVEGVHYQIDRSRRSLELLREGREEIFRDDAEIPWELLRRPWETYIRNALKGDHFFHRDEQYVVLEDKIVIVDEFTGRAFEDRTWREGQHQAIEVKEGTTIRPESGSAASITRQRFFALYETICGLTGTAAESAGELWRFFKLPVAQIPLHKPCRRSVLPERIFAGHAEMDHAIAEDILSRFRRGQPVLVGTRAIRDSERLSESLKQREIPHRVLTAKQDAEEDSIISTAGECGSVVIATNMAGRGTHIALSDEAETLGGLHVIVVERNDAKRIDRQLVGRGARQGQAGSTQSFVSADDELIRNHAPSMQRRLKSMSASSGGELPGTWSRAFDKVQAEVERRRYDARLRMAERDKWLEETREAITQ